MCCLAFSPVETECSGCGRPVPPGLAGFTDEIETLMPVCETCLRSLDPVLYGMLRKPSCLLQRELAGES